MRLTHFGNAPSVIDVIATASQNQPFYLKYRNEIFIGAALLSGIALIYLVARK